ncbi:centromere DNA-binding protein complex CBF3 subunit [Hirsutella rhossiliensis]|uniref:Centromere DNA-binding protein complex CBF3 subunit n=1 Tax=Hirsutella rhossiliensis TaxID=111463 RepID=A0A9P8MU04_9HYPO|nr:centromere DNA-binding protein complex CBF3 subunit [Hirsutella rhossiliensis]KAH0960404.1 centromere DNA-binding protein complex CBF3 subunit [Hirsutella rhossiliensis]
MRRRSSLRSTSLGQEYDLGYCDGATVTEEKLLLFLVEEVAGRPLKVRSRKAATDTPQDETRLAWRSVRTYVTAITDLYRTQKALGMNTHPSPREDNVREYLKSLQRRDAQRDRENYADKGRDTLLDGYSESEFERVCHELWAHSGTSPECHFRTLVDLLFGHYLLTRGGDRRAAEISDLFTFEFAGEGSTRCMPLIFTTRAGKQNQHGRLETAGAYRNRNPLICILGGLSFYLLYRWDLGSEPFPDFSRRSSWYDIRLIKGNGTGRTAAFSYNSQREWVVKAFAYAGVTSQKKTHVGRSSGRGRLN